jgi:uncharacterized protein YndB with AHSA1/START domain
MHYDNSDLAGREQRTSILLDAPVAEVWQIWTEPALIQDWWGPNGFTNIIEKMEVVNGGEWLFDMVGPDGTKYPNRTVFREVIPYEKIVHEHFAPNFIAVITFESQGDQTKLTWYKLYETKELFDLVEIHYKSSEGLQQTIQKMKEYLRR